MNMFDFSELDKLVSNLSKAARGSDKDVQKEVDIAVDYLVSQAKSGVPVKTGYLKSSITAEKSGKQKTFTVRSKYGKYVEFGTSKMRARNYVKPALRKTYSKIDKDLEKLADQIIKRV